MSDPTPQLPAPADGTTTAPVASDTPTGGLGRRWRRRDGDPGTPPAPSAESTPVAVDGYRIPVTSFDLSEGRFASSAKLRQLNVIVAAVALLVVAAVASRGIIATVEAQVLVSDLERAQARSAELARELNERRDRGEQTQQEVDDYIEALASAAVEVVGTEIDYQRLVAELSNLGPGTTVSSITLGDPPADGPADVVHTITVTGRSDTSDTAVAVDVQLRDQTRFPYLVNPEAASINCGQDADGAQACTWTWKGSLTTQIRTPRADRFAEQFGVSAAGTTGTLAPPDADTPAGGDPAGADPDVATEETTS
jgi:hypothetical protein